MIAMVSAILFASLLGSMHCVGMCGAFVALAVGESRGWRAAAAYHGGRLISYVLLGAIAGAAGTLMNVAGAMAGIRPIAAIFAGATMVVFGGIMLLRLWGVRIAHMRLAASWSRLVSRISMKAMNRPLVIRAGMIGLATTLLPCGWLYAFAVTAAGTASPLQGAAVMAIFWLGTLPALVVVGAGVRGLLGPIGKRAPALTSLLLVIVGLYTLIGRSMLDPLAIAQRVQNKAGMTATTQPAACCTQQAS